MKVHAYRYMCVILSDNLWIINIPSILELFQNNLIGLAFGPLRFIMKLSLNKRSISSKLLKMIFSRPKCPLKRRSSLKNSVENYHVFPKKIFKRCPKTTYAIRSRFLSSSEQLKNPLSRVPKVTQVFRVIFMFEKICRGMTTHLNAHSNDKKWIFKLNIVFSSPEIGTSLASIGNYFWSSAILAFQIQVSIQKF